MAIKCDERMVNNIFFEGEKLLNKKAYNQAIERFLKVIKLSENTSYPSLSGAYTNLANATFQSDPLNPSNREEALGYIKKALQIKPSNQAAKSIGIPILVIQKDYANAINLFLELTSNEAILHSIPYLELMEKSSMLGESSIKAALPAIEDLYQKYKKRNPKFGNILANTYQSIGENQKAFQTHQEIFTNFSNEPFILLHICVNFSLFCITIKNNTEAKNIVNQGITIYKNQKASFRKQNEYLYDMLINHLGLSCMGLHEYQEAVNLLKPLVERNPENAALHNLSYALYRLGDNEQALKYCNRALYIVADETSLFVKAEILYSKNMYKEALTIYKKTIVFIENENYIEFVNGNKQMIFSYRLDQGENLKAYVGLTHCYIALKDYLSAKASVQLLLKKSPYDDELIKMDKNIDTLMEHLLTEDAIQCKMQMLQKDIKEQKKILMNELFEVRDWALKLLKIQTRCIKDDKIILDNEEDWRVILKQMHDIAVTMKETKNDLGVNYIQIKENFAKQYPNINSNSLEFLSTGEFLYQIHQESEIDFAPIMVEYSKVIETELNLYLKNKKIIKKNQSLTLGQLKHTIQKVKIENLPYINEFLEQLITYRNGSAHTGKSTRNKVGLVRDMILSEGWLKLILK